MSSLQHKLFSLFCISTLIGIWPRFIEPNLLTTTRLTVTLKNLKRPLKIVQLSDLHLGTHTKAQFLQRILKKTAAFQPDLILLTGDYLCYGSIHDQAQLTSFFKALKAPLGVYAILGNHDYSGGITVNDKGDYDLSNVGSTVAKGFKLLFKKQHLTGKIQPAVASIESNPELLKAFIEGGVTLLNNENVKIDSLINLTGLPEYMSGQMDLKKAYEGFDPSLPGILLSHNPDALPALLETPSDMILSGHTHGGQVNLPWFRERFTLMEHPHYFTGLLKEKGKTIYISRGLGSVMPFRFFAPPEVVMINCLPKGIE